jgi:hypothetical protein
MNIVNYYFYFCEFRTEEGKEGEVSGVMKITITDTSQYFDLIKLIKNKVLSETTLKMRSDSLKFKTINKLN